MTPQQIARYIARSAEHQPQNIKQQKVILPPLYGDPPATDEPVVIYDPVYECGGCGHDLVVEYPEFCPKCGARLCWF